MYHILQVKINRNNVLKTKKLCKGKKVFLRNGFYATSSTNNMKVFLAFFYTRYINLNIIPIKIYNNKLNMV